MKKSLPKPFRITHMYFWGALIVLVILTGIYVAILFSIKKFSEHAATVGAEATALETNQSEASKLRKNVEATDQNLQQLTSHFINANDIVPFLETVEGYGRTTRTTTKFDTVTVGKSPDNLTISLTATGSFTDVYRFIALLESAPYEISFSNVGIQSTSPLDGGAQNKKLKASVWEAHVTLSVLSIIPAEQ